ncbi:MAG TPA: dihydrolipoyl dehydrogenase [Tepidisphaeraceae bacterium]|jgi:dihydrolipoamide dehydrogenase|nr:dihydrolipoyl dehydrogenase [Tepidisphaeraceae bacterium]
MTQLSVPSYDLIVIGAGPGGYVAAIRAAQLGMKVACVEREYLGGTCLNVGCIPSKALLDSSHRYAELKHGLTNHGINVSGVALDLAKMLERKNKVVAANTNGVAFLFKKNKIDHVKGTGRIVKPGVVEVTGAAGKQTLECKNILIATGSAPVQLPALPFDGKNVISSTEALTLSEVPKKMVIVGAGYIGVEMGSVWNRLGAEVLILEFLDRAVPGMDKEVGGLLQKSLEKQGIKFRFKTVAESAKVEGGKIKVTWSSGSEKGVEEVDKVMVSVGRRPVTDGLGLAEAGVEVDKKGFVVVDKKTFATRVPGIYAIGDVVGNPMLAHKAEEEGIACVETMAGKAGHVNYHTIPAVCYTHPEIAQVGLTEDDAKAAGHEVAVGKFPFTANGRARCMDETEGLVKIVADAKTDRILGVHILHARASEMIAEATVAMEFHASSEDVARANHAHPTLPEAIKEAAMAVEKRAIHI